jgi:hypothetical protein
MVDEQMGESILINSAVILPICFMVSPDYYFRILKLPPAKHKGTFGQQCR